MLRFIHLRNLSYIIICESPESQHRVQLFFSVILFHKVLPRTRIRSSISCCEASVISSASAAATAAASASLLASSCPTTRDASTSSSAVEAGTCLRSFWAARVSDSPSAAAAAAVVRALQSNCCRVILSASAGRCSSCGGCCLCFLAGQPLPCHKGSLHFEFSCGSRAMFQRTLGS